MNVTHGNNFWDENVGIIKEYPYLSKNRNCDVLVVGAGIGGALTAFMQAKQGANVVVVDKNLIGCGATIGTNGLIDSRLDFNSKILKNVSEKNINKCNTLCKEAIEDIKDIIDTIILDEECKKYIESLGYRCVDLMYYSDKITNKISMFKMFEKLGRKNSDIEYLEEDPIINLRTGIIFPKDAIIFNPYVLTQLIFLYLSKLKNVEIYENTCVTSISNKENVVESVTYNKFKIYSKCVVLTNGIHALEFLKEDSLSLNKTFTIVTENIESLDGNVIDIVAKSVSSPGFSIAFTKDKRLILSGEDVKQNERMLNDGYFKSFADGKYKKMYYHFRKQINLPQDVKITNCFDGMYLDTKDSLPIIDEIDNKPNVYYNIGVGKNGIVYSMIGAKMLKDITKQYHLIDMHLFKQKRD